MFSIYLPRQGRLYIIFLSIRLYYYSLQISARQMTYYGWKGFEGQDLTLVFPLSYLFPMFILIQVYLIYVLKLCVLFSLL